MRPSQVRKAKEQMIAIRTLIREGYGVEDIALKRRIGEDLVRDMVATLRRQRLLIIDPPEVRIPR